MLQEETLSLFIMQKLANLPVISTRPTLLAAVDTTNHPPVTFNLQNFYLNRVFKKKCVFQNLPPFSVVLVIGCKRCVQQCTVDCQGQQTTFWRPMAASRQLPLKGKRQQFFREENTIFMEFPEYSNDNLLCILSQK